MAQGRSVQSEGAVPRIDLLSLMMLRCWQRPDCTTASRRKASLAYPCRGSESQASTESRPFLGGRRGLRPSQPWSLACSPKCQQHIPDQTQSAGCPAKAEAFMNCLTPEKHICDVSPQGPHVLRDSHLPNSCIYQAIIYSFSHF